MSKETQNNEEIANNQFAEWENPAEVLFEPTEEVDSTEKLIAEVLKDKPTPAKEDSEEDEESTEDDYTFDFGGDEEDEDEEEDEILVPGKKEQSAKVSSKAAVEFLKEKGLINYELEEGTELTDELADEILEDDREASIDAGVAEQIKGLPEVVKDLIRFVNKGGDYTDFLGSMIKQSTAGVNKDTDMEQESNQVLVLTKDLKKQGYDDEYIEGQVAYLKDSGKLKSIADKLFTKDLNDQEAERQAKLQSAEAQKADNREKQKVYKSGIAEKVTALEEVKGIILNKKDKETLPSYISDVNVKLADGRTVTKFQQDLFSVFGDTEKTILLAKLINSDFDFSSIANKEITKFSKNIKTEIQNNKVEIKGSKGSSQRQKKSLVDLLD